MKIQPVELLPKCQRRPVNKSFSGCRTCKARKLKCDESRPACLGCRSTGRICPGYFATSRLRWSKKHEVLGQPHEALKNETIWPARSRKARTSYTMSSQPPCLQEIVAFTDGDAVPNPIINRLFDEDDASNGTSAQDTQARDGSYEVAGSASVEDQKPVTEVPLNLSPSRTSHRRYRYPGLNDIFAEPTDIHSVLIPFYFNVVCPLFSTFDSPRNLFRSFVEERWQESRLLFYTMLSMAAAKLSRKDHVYRARALTYQSQALHDLRTRVSRATSWSTELGFVILMLGLSTAWHDITDLGIAHLRAMQQAVRHLSSGDDDKNHLHIFFENALVYWEMVTSFVDGDVPLYAALKPRPAPFKPISPCERSGDSAPTTLDLHPWTGVSSVPQQIFTRLMRLIQRTRAQDLSSWALQQGSSEQANILQSAEDLERELWTFQLPTTYRIYNTGDMKTPTSHHILLAEAYVFANFFQLYHCFPRLYRERHDSMIASTPATQPYPAFVINAPTFCRSDLWPAYEQFNECLSFLGTSIIQRLQRIPPSSGTLCVQPLLLLVASASLSNETSGSVHDVREMRQFVLDRLAHSSNAYLSEPMHHVRMAVIEIFKLLDEGHNVFWMDVLRSMRLMTIIG